MWGSLKPCSGDFWTFMGNLLLQKYKNSDEEIQKKIPYLHETE